MTSFQSKASPSLTLTPPTSTGGMLRFSQAGSWRVDRLGVAAGPELQIDAAVDAAPAALALLEVADPADHLEVHVAVARQVLEHSGDPHRRALAAADDRHRLADDVDSAEALQRLAPAQHQVVDVPQRGGAVAVEEGDVEDPEEALVGPDHRREARLAVAQEDRLGAFGAGDRLDLREILGHRLGDDAVGALLAADLPGLGIGMDALDLEDPVGVRQPLVVAGLVADVEQDHQAGGKADRQADDVDEGVGLALRQGPVADGQIIAPHRLHRFSP